MFSHRSVIASLVACSIVVTAVAGAQAAPQKVHRCGRVVFPMTPFSARQITATGLSCAAARKVIRNPNQSKVIDCGKGLRCFTVAGYHCVLNVGARTSTPSSSSSPEQCKRGKRVIFWLDTGP